MEITEVNIKLATGNDKRLMGYASIAFDNEFVIRDLKIIRNGSRYFVAMPSRKMTDHCSHCDAKNFLMSRHCHMCGMRLKRGGEASTKMHADIAHPITPATRFKIEKTILEAYLHEIENAKKPDYACCYDSKYYQQTA